MSIKNLAKVLTLTKACSSVNEFGRYPIKRLLAASGKKWYISSHTTANTKLQSDDDANYFIPTFNSCNHPVQSMQCSTSCPGAKDSRCGGHSDRIEEADRTRLCTLYFGSS